MAELFRFSPRPNRAGEVQWRDWGAAAFDEAAHTDRPVFLNLTAVWCEWCHRMDETAFSDPDSIALLNREVLPIRVDADRYPHVQERYIAGGWPTNAFLTPTGEVLWAGTYVPAEEFRAVLHGVLAAWRDRRAELRIEIERRRKALEAARGRHRAVGLVRRGAADTVLLSIQQGFDAVNGGFGGAPKFPQPEAVEFLFARGFAPGGAEARAMAGHTLDGMLAGELRDEVEGGFFRYAMAADWTSPRHEKLLEVNAGLLRVYALGAQVSGRADWRAVAEGTVDWVEGVLRLPDGLWGASQAAEAEYYALDVDGRRGRPRPFVDPVLYTAPVAVWIRALAEAGGRLGRRDWIERAAGAMDALLSVMAGPEGMLYHYRVPGESPDLATLLVDTLEAARACVSLSQATGRAGDLAKACELAEALEAALWAEDGGFFDHVSGPGDVGAVRYRDRPFDRNAAAARLFLDLAAATGERSYRAVAERILALLSPVAGRYGVAAAEFALAVDEFFEPPPSIFVVGATEAAAPLRHAALAFPDARRRVWSLERGGRIGGFDLAAAATPVAYICGARACSAPIDDPARLARAARAAR
ncbi:MAG TPA: DUF255 domain-containing protein [Longimicrobiales bacterium]